MTTRRRPTIPDCGPLLTTFDGKARPPLARGRRGSIDRRCMLPDLPALLAIDAAAEAAVAQATIDGDARAAGGTAGDTLGGSVPQRGDVTDSFRR